VQNFNPSSPVLGYRQTSQVGGVSCAPAPGGVTCRATTGVGKGHGFRINANEVVRVG
jgi:hypothetical protein